MKLKDVLNEELIFVLDKFKKQKIWIEKNTFDANKHKLIKVDSNNKQRGWYKKKDVKANWNKR